MPYLSEIIMKKTTPIHPSLQRVLDTSSQSMEDVASLLGVTPTTVSRWAKQGISPQAANKLAKLLNLDPVWILTGKNATKSKSSKSKPSKMTAKEAFLEFVEVESGLLVLREVGTSEALVSIAFAEKVRDMVGAEHLQTIGQHMISAAIATVMERQMKQYHAHVYDEEPKRFS